MSSALNDEFLAELLGLVPAHLSLFSSVRARFGMCCRACSRCSFFNIVISQGGAAKWWIFNDHFIANLLLNVSVKEFLKSINI